MKKCPARGLMSNLKQRVSGEVQVVEFETVAGLTRFSLLLIPADQEQDPQRVSEPSDYLATLSVNAPYNTQQARAYDLAAWFGWCKAQDADWRQADARTLTLFVSALQTTPRGQPLGAKTGALALADRSSRSITSVKRAVKSLRDFYGWAADNERVEERISKRVNAFKTARAPMAGRADRLSAAQVEQLMEEVKDRPRERCFVQLMYGCGLRIGQALALQFRDLHFEQDNTELHDCSIRGAHLHIVPRPASELPPGVSHKTTRPYWVPVPQAVTLAYGDWLSARLQALDQEDESPFILVGLNGQARGYPLGMAAAQKSMQRLAAKLAFDPPFHAHLLRHTFASELTDVGVSTLTLQTLLGHSHPTSTAVYMHPLEDEMSAAVDKLSAYREARLS